MAIMWDAADPTPSLDESPADIAWRLWLIETLAQAQTDEAGHLRLVPAETAVTDYAPSAVSGNGR
jgi:hypothetical protein